MNPTIRMIGLDLDGTVFNNEKQITPAVRLAIADAIAAGIYVLPATGRQLSGVPRAFLDIEGVRYALTANGARITDLGTGELLYTDFFTKERGEQLALKAKGYDTMTSIFAGGECYSENVQDKFFAGMAEELVTYMRSTRIEVPDLYRKICEMPHPVEKFSLVFADEDERQRAWRDFAAEGDVAVTSSIDFNIEINTATANKGAGLVALGKKLGIPREEIMAIGDASNDIEMLSTVGYGVAMGNAEDAVKQVARAVTLTNEEDGVAHAIRAIL